MNWTFVKDKPPKVRKAVLVYTNYGNYEVAKLGSNGYWSNPDEEWIYFDEFPVAWMPLPKAPEVERVNDD